MKNKYALTCCFFAAFFSLCILAASGRALAGTTTVIVIGDKPFPCRIVKHDEKTITVYLIELKTTTEIEWEKLAPMERRRLQNVVRASEVPTGIPLGKKIDGVEVVLKTGMAYRGIELTDRRTKSHRYFRFPKVPFMALSVKDIKKVNKIKLYEGEIYTPKERYQFKLAVSPPTSAEDHFRMAEWCIDNELVDEATDHLAKCQLLDESYSDRCKDKKTLLDQMAKKVQARRLYAQLLQDKAAGRLGQVLKTIDLLASSYPDFEENTKLTMEKPLIEANRKRQLRRETVNLFYQYMDHFIQKISYERKSDTPPIPQKVVVLKSGFTIKGRLKGSAEAETVMIENDGRTYSIRRDLIARIDTQLIEKGPFRWRTLAECRRYVTNRKGGISADIVAAISKDLGIEDKEVLQIWNARLSDVYEVGDNGIKVPEQVAAYQDAHWGVGSWLRGGSGNASAAPASSASTSGRPSRGTRGTRTGGSNNNANQPKWDDPETWWKKQRPDTKARILRAMCAEAICNVVKVYRENCLNCGGTGAIEHMDAGIGGSGGRYKAACHVCRGSGTFWGVTYR